MTEFTDDRFLDGRVSVRQPAQGFRSGLDAVMLAAAIPAVADDIVLEFGCGAGVASLCLASRRATCRITGVDIDSALVDLAGTNGRANEFESRVQFVTGDVLELPAELRRDFDHVFANPPFHDSSGNQSPHEGRAAALADDRRLGEWLVSGLRRVRSHGTFTVIIRADRLGEVLAHLPDRGVILLPLWPRHDEPAKRVIIQVRKDSRTPLALLPGLVLHDAKGGYTPEANAVLRDGGSLALGSPPL